MSGTKYVMSNLDIRDVSMLEQFIIANLPSDCKFYTLSYDGPGKTLTVQTRELTSTETTREKVTDLVLNKFPNPPMEDFSDPSMVKSASDTSNFSVYGYLPSGTHFAVDGDVVLTKNVTLTRNMYYRNLTVRAGVNLKTSGWRVVVSDILTVDGTISCNGNSAVQATGGSETSSYGSTYLGPGWGGAEGLIKNGNGAAAPTALCYTLGGKGGNGGMASGYVGGLAATQMPISQADGGHNILYTLPTAFVGRLPAENFMLSGGCGGGAGALNRGQATTARSGGGGSGGGLLLIAARIIEGAGKLTAIGGEGSSASYTGTTSAPSAGAGGGGGGGAIIVVTHSLIPSTITVDVSAGKAGVGIPPENAATQATPGNAFIVRL